MSESRVDLSVIIICHKQEHMLSRCVKSLENGLQGIRAEIIVLDNVGRQRVEKHLASSSIPFRIITNPVPRGLGYNINRAAAKSRARYLLQLNPDMIHHDGQIADAMGYMEKNRDIGVVCCQLLNPDGTIQQSYRRFPTLPVVIARALSMDHWLWKPRFYRYRMMSEQVFEIPHAVDWVFGAFMLMRRNEFSELGGMDPALHIYYTDVDMCYRYRINGQKSSVYPGIRFIHEHQRTSAKYPFGRHWRSHLRSAYRYFKKHGYIFRPDLE